MVRLYAALCVLGAAVPLWFFGSFLADEGIDVGAFFDQMTDSDIALFAWADVVVAALAVIAFRRQRTRPAVVARRFRHRPRRALVRPAASPALARTRAGRTNVCLTSSARPASLIEHMFAEGGVMLTARQRQILDFLTSYLDQHGYPPTVREIGEAVGLASPSTVHAHLANLERAGLIRRDPTKPRALELVERLARSKAAEPADDVHRLPLVGEIAAGGPVLAEENVEDYLAVPEPLARGDGEEFVLRVKGESMVQAGILDGDYVVVRRQQDARNGDVVAALAGQDEGADEATVKRFFREDGRVRLQPENDALEPIYADHVQILGKVIGVFRRL